VRREEQKRIDDILGLWVSCQSKHESIESIIREGPTVGGKWLENKGNFPQTSSFNLDIMAGKVDKMRKFDFSEEERLVYSIITNLPWKLKKLLTEHRDRRNRNNAETNARWTHADIARLLGYQEDRYHILRDGVCIYVIDIFNAAQKKKKSKLTKRLVLQLNHGNDKLFVSGESCHN
jgi:hypothetical protein